MLLLAVLDSKYNWQEGGHLIDRWLLLSRDGVQMKLLPAGRQQVMPSLYVEESGSF